FWVQWEVHAKDFLSPSKTSTPFDMGASGSMQLDPRNKPDREFPLEPFSVEATVDLIVDQSLTIVSSMPVHRKAAFGAFDFDSSYKSGHLLEKHSMELTGSVIQPADWDAFVEFLKSGMAELSKGSRFERHSVSASTAAPSSFAGLAAAGSAAYRRGDYEEAKRKYLEATQLDPRSRSVWNSLGRAYYALRDYAKAEEAYKHEIEINPDEKYAYRNIGLVYRARLQDDEAMEWFRKQISIYPRDPSAHFDLVIGYAAKRQWEKALEEALIASEISPEDATRWSRLGQAQIKRGQIEEGAKSLDRALALVHNATIENDVAFYLADAGIQLDRAMKLILGALEPQARGVCESETLSKDDKCAAPLRRLASMLDTAGWALYRQGKYAEAEPYLLSGEAIIPRAYTELHLAATLAKLGHVDESLKHFAVARSRHDFARFDSEEVRQVLANLLDGEEKLDSRLQEMQSPAGSGTTGRVLVLVDGRGKVLDVQPADDKTAASLVEDAKSLTLLPITWPGHSIRSVRTIEFRQDGSRESYVGPSANR
ncbi:MAG TPA: tetratricopeptide repeat protein, partial [Bryobacteraceae bacterium]|nr:tetratricopeptide repeat protein [Bryobacteraceae bacterium]